MLDLVGNPNCWFSHSTAQMIKHYLALLAYSMADIGFSLIASVNSLMASSRLPKRNEFAFEPLNKKFNNLHFRPGLTQTNLQSHRSRLEL